MGRIKVHRQNLNNLIQSVSSKSIYQWLITQTRTRFGVALQEAYVIAEKADILITERWNILAGNQFYLQLPCQYKNHKKRPKDQLTHTTAKLTAFDHSDLELYQQCGLKVMQNSRLVRYIEEAYCQNALISYTELCLLTQTTAKSIRERMIPLWNQGVRLHINGMSTKYRNHRLFRSTLALQEYFGGTSLTHLQSTLFFNTSLWRTWQRHFVHVLQKEQECSNPSSVAESLGFSLELVTEYIDLALSLKDNPRYHEFISTYQDHLSKEANLNYDQSFLWDLEVNHNFSKAKSRLYLEMLRELRDQTLQTSRKPNEIVYYAISHDESAGKALAECQLKPVQISWWTDKDFQVLNLDSTKDLKWQKIMRFSSEVHKQGACLNQSDLAFILGVHPAVIQKQMKSHHSTLLPTRGNVADIGPGMTHIEKILELFLQGYTETEIVRRTGHSYSSIENYISMFSRVVSLLERNMPLPLIRQTIGCSMKLVEKHVSLYNKYNTPEYQFMLMQVRRIFHNLSSKNNSKKKQTDKGVNMGRSKIVKRRYDSLLERNLVSAQKQELILPFELSQESWLAETVIQKFNKQMNEYESELGLNRMQPGCLLVSFRGQLLQIPLLTEKGATLLAQGQSFINHRKIVSEHALSCFKAIDPSVTVDEVSHYINRRNLLHPWAEGECKRTNLSYSGKLINPAKVNAHPPRKISTDEVTIPIKVRERLLDFLVSEAGVAPSQATAMLQFLAARREAYCPPVSQLNPGQVVWLSFSSTKKKPNGVQFARRIVMPIVITLFTEEELKRPIATLPELNKLHSEQSARILVEAYLQDTLIPQIELGLLFLRSYSSMGNLIRSYMETHQVILPTPGTILDAGRAMTHKHIIVAQSVAGHFTSEIARKTYHTPESVDAYLKVFQSVLILSLYDMPVPLMARVTGRGQALVKEYIELVEEHFPNRHAIRMYLAEQGVAIA